MNARWLPRSPCAQPPRVSPQPLARGVPLLMLISSQSCGGPQKLWFQSGTPDNINAAPVAFTFRNGVGDVISQSRRLKAYFGAHSAIRAGNLNRSTVSHDGPVVAPLPPFSFCACHQAICKPARGPLALFAGPLAFLRSPVRAHQRSPIHSAAIASTRASTARISISTTSCRCSLTLRLRARRHDGRLCRTQPRSRIGVKIPLGYSHKSREKGE
jgi:hypothetical protein